MSTITTRGRDGRATPETVEQPRREAPPDDRVYALLGEFETPGKLLEAARRTRDEGYKHWDVHSPFPIHGIDSAMGTRMTVLPWVVMVGGIAGCLTGLLLQWYTNAAGPSRLEWVDALPTFLQGYAFRISGKPYFSLPANIPIIFELTVLFAAITTVLFLLIFNNQPLWYNPLFNSRNFAAATDDKLFICIEARDRRFDLQQTQAFLESVGARSVETVVEHPSPARYPRTFVYVGSLIIVLLLIPPLIVWNAWYSKSEWPRIHIVQDMDNQQKFKPQQPGPFNDQRIMRPVVPGTVARGELFEDRHYYEGLVGPEQFATTFPLYRPEITMDEYFVQRGRGRFNIYCAPCHGVDGSGNGMVNQRAQELEQPGWVPPVNLHDEEIRNRPVGHIFNTITNGIRTMPAYGARIPVKDRWAIIAYVRALQRSQHAPLKDLTPEQRQRLEAR